MKNKKPLLNIAGEGIEAENANWSFSGETVKSFDSHVEKSVPLYHEGHDMICRLSDFFLPQDSLCYELGTSTGTLLERLGERHKNRTVKFVGLDCEEDMINKASVKLAELENIHVETADILNYEFEKADLIVAYYTMQFIQPRFRQEIFNKIYESLNWGGAFILFEKIRGDDARFQDIWTSIYSDYKLEQGYSPDEIVTKSRSLKGVLEPFSSQGNFDLLQRAGFEDTAIVMRYVPFSGFLAIK